MLIAYEAEGCKMSLKVHFLHSHTVKIKIKDFTRMSMMSRDDTKEDGKSTCQLITVGYSGGKQKMEESAFRCNLAWLLVTGLLGILCAPASSSCLCGSQ
ncbi:hypothetical protein AVEN_204565-1 [Araneus ventricosus]|uniref:Uncharacterized protein n=1 Tax=Araneus ventricosus TaxID=182803 RepID=A0A4Y2SK81_ARAVE|nr:hypothetical protein AVEN_204565-1 [Araneus ventricosus]